jgi:hypothetical protein
MTMRFRRVHIFAAGVVAFLLGIPFTEKAFAGFPWGDLVGGIIDTSIWASAGDS